MSTPHRPSNPILIVILALAVLAFGIDITDGDRAKIFTSLMIVVGIVALFLARHYDSTRWRMVMLIAFVLAVVGMIARLAMYQGWV